MCQKSCGCSCDTYCTCRQIVVKEVRHEQECKPQNQPCVEQEVTIVRNKKPKSECEPMFEALKELFCKKANVPCNLAMLPPVISYGADTATVSVITSGAINVEYSIDNINWQASNVFHGISISRIYYARQIGTNCIVAKYVELDPSQVCSFNIIGYQTNCKNVVLETIGGRLPFQISIDNSTWLDGTEILLPDYGTYTLTLREKNNPNCSRGITLTITSTQCISTCAIKINSVTFDCNSNKLTSVSYNGITTPVQFQLDSGTWVDDFNQLTNISDGQHELVAADATNHNCFDTYVFTATSCIDNTCLSTQIPIITADLTNVCTGSQVTFTATNCNRSVNWYALNGVSPSENDVLLKTGSLTYSRSINSPISVYARCQCSDNSFTDNSNIINISLKSIAECNCISPSTLTIQSDKTTICSDSATLSVVGIIPSGVTVQWINQANNSILGTGNTYQASLVTDGSYLDVCAIAVNSCGRSPISNVVRVVRNCTVSCLVTINTVTYSCVSKSIIADYSTTSGVSSVEFSLDDSTYVSSLSLLSVPDGTSTLYIRAVNSINCKSSAQFTKNCPTCSLSTAVFNTTATCVTSNGIDVTPVAIVTNIANPKTGDKLIFGVTVKNIGDTGTTTTTGVRFSINGTPVTYSDNYTDLIPSGGITPAITANGNYTTGDTSYNYWIPTTAGTYTLEAWVNDIGRYPESNTTNNKITQTIVVVDPTATTSYTVYTGINS